MGLEQPVTTGWNGGVGEGAAAGTEAGAKWAAGTVGWAGAAAFAK